MSSCFVLRNSKVSLVSFFLFLGWVRFEISSAFLINISQSFRSRLGLLLIGVNPYSSYILVVTVVQLLVSSPIPFCKIKEKGSGSIVRAWVLVRWCILVCPSSLFTSVFLDYRKAALPSLLSLTVELNSWLSVPSL